MKNNVNNKTDNKYDNTSSIQRHYMSALEKASDSIGLDPHEIRLINKNLSPTLINLNIGVMFLQGQKYIEGYRRYNPPATATKMNCGDLQSYIEDIQKDKIHKYRNYIDIADSVDSIEANAHTILTDLYYAYNHGLRLGFQEAFLNFDSIYEKIPPHLFSDQIAKVNKIELSKTKR